MNIFRTEVISYWSYQFYSSSSSRFFWFHFTLLSHTYHLTFVFPHSHCFLCFPCVFTSPFSNSLLWRNQLTREKFTRTEKRWVDFVTSTDHSQLPVIFLVSVSRQGDIRLMVQKSGKLTTWSWLAVSLPYYLQDFIHPNGGWPWDFWTINSILHVVWTFFFTRWSVWFLKYCVPGTYLSIFVLYFGASTLQNKAQTPIKTRAIWVPGKFMNIYLHISSWLLEDSESGGIFKVSNHYGKKGSKNWSQIAVSFASCFPLLV